MAAASSRAFLKRTLQKATGFFAVRKQVRGSCTPGHAAETLVLIGGGTACDAKNLDFLCIDWSRCVSELGVSEQPRVLAAHRRWIALGSRPAETPRVGKGNAEKCDVPGETTALLDHSKPMLPGLRPPHVCAEGGQGPVPQWGVSVSQGRAGLGQVRRVRLHGLREEVHEAALHRRREALPLLEGVRQVRGLQAHARERAAGAPMTGVTRLGGNQREATGIVNRGVASGKKRADEERGPVW